MNKNKPGRNTDSTFGKNLKRELEKADLQQNILAEWIYVHPRTVNDWVRGRTEPTISSIVRICEILRCTPNDLMLEGNTNVN